MPRLLPRLILAGLLGGVVAPPSAAPALAGEKTDVIVMRNGDRITCEIKGLQGGILYVSVDYIDGTISIQWSKVRRIESTQLFIVKTEDGTVYTGTIRALEGAGSRPVALQVAEGPDQVVEMPARQVVLLDQTAKAFWQRFNGDVNFGFIYSKGNDTAQYSLNTDVSYPRPRWTAAASFSSTLSTGAGIDDSARNQAQLSGLRLLRRKRWYYQGLASFLQSSEQQIALQTTLGGVIGRYLTETNNAKVALAGGLGWQNTRYDTSAPDASTQDTLTAIVGTQVSFFKFKKTSVDVSAQLLPALSELGRVHFDMDASYYVKVLGDLTWNVSFYGNWDNRPPADVAGADYGGSIGLGWTFGNR